MRDSRHRSLQRSVAPSWPRYRSSCPPSRGTHRLRAGAPRSPAAGGRVWPLPPSSLLPVKARESHTRCFEDRGCHLCPESAHLPPCGLSLAPLSCLQEITGCASLSAPRHGSLPHACTPRPRHGLESPAHTGSRLSWPHQSQARQEAPGRAKLFCGDKGRVLSRTRVGGPHPCRGAAAAMAQAEPGPVGMQGLRARRHFHALSS